MTTDRYHPAMQAGRRRRARRRAATVAVAMAAAVLGGCGDDDSASNTLIPLDGAPGASGPDATSTGDVEVSVDTAVDPAQAGVGFVSIQVRLPSAGIDETLSLDRATLRADALNPVSLDATCTALDGGDGMTVSVVDLNRLAAGSRLVSAALRTAGPPTAGTHDVTLDVGAADQVTTTYTGTVELTDGGWSGTFETADAAGNAASGTFVCSDAPIATTTAPPDTGGEEVPDTEPAD